MVKQRRAVVTLLATATLGGALALGACSSSGNSSATGTSAGIPLAPEISDALKQASIGLKYAE